MTPVRPTARATPTFGRHVPPVREPQRAAMSTWPAGKAAPRPGARMGSIACAHTRHGRLEIRSSAQGCGTTRQPTVSRRSDHHASQREADSAAGFDIRHLLMCDDLRTHAWSPHRLRDRGRPGGRAAAQPRLRSASCKPTNMSAWSAHRSEAALRNDIRRIDTMHAAFS
ncbi:hypothetical protein [Burkholderia ambifaria]|uniref:hypothetical protein n=2 Tax=Burkholderiaceae TaxID=119060 RepID=UPI00158A5F7A